MDLRTELTAATQSGCRLCGYLGGLSLAEKAQWDASLAEPVETVGNTAVVKALRKRGIILTEASVRRHRANHGGR